MGHSGLLPKYCRPPPPFTTCSVVVHSRRVYSAEEDHVEGAEGFTDLPSAICPLRISMQMPMQAHLHDTKAPWDRLGQLGRSGQSGKP